MQNCLLKNKPGSLGQTKLRGEKQEAAAAAVELTSLFVLVSNALYTEHTSLFKQEIVPSLKQQQLQSKCGNRPFMLRHLLAEKQLRGSKRLPEYAFSASKEKSHYLIKIGVA